MLSHYKGSAMSLQEIEGYFKSIIMVILVVGLYSYTPDNKCMCIMCRILMLLSVAQIVLSIHLRLKYNV